MIENRTNRLKRIRQVTLVGSLIDVLLGCFKIIVGFLTHSHALIADGIHSFSDLATDVMVLIVARYSHKGPDAEHPYGHGRFETMGVVLLGSFLVGIAGAIIYDNSVRLIGQAESIIPTWPALIIAAMSIVAKEWMYRYTLVAGKELKSDLLIANAWHSRSDAISSLVALLGIGGALFGYPWLDSAAAILVGLLIAYVGLKLIWNSIRELVDTGLSTNEVQTIKDCILSVSGVVGIHSLRSRRMGSDVLLDVHIQVDPQISVSEGHNVGTWAEKKILKQFSAINDVTFHIDTDADEANDFTSTDMLPLRKEVIEVLKMCWQGIANIESIDHITLHYIEGKVTAEIFLPESLLATNEFKSDLFQEAVVSTTQELSWLGKIRVWYGEVIV